MTPAIKRLEAEGVTFDTLSYEIPEERGVSLASEQGLGVAAARVLGVPEEEMFKTLIAELDNGNLAVTVIPVAETLDLKRLSRAAGVRRASLADTARAERATGYLTGGISPFGQKKASPTFLDASARTLSRVYVSGGKRGLQLAVATEDLIRCCRAQVVALCRDAR